MTSNQKWHKEALQENSGLGERKKIPNEWSEGKEVQKPHKYCFRTECVETDLITISTCLHKEEEISEAQGLHSCKGNFNKV